MNKINTLVSKENTTKWLYFFLFIFSIIEIYGEVIMDDLIISISKPLLLPLILVIYLNESNKKNLTYMIALLANWIANILFQSIHSELIFIATMLFLLSKIFLFVTIYQKIKATYFVSIIIGSIPYLVLFIYLLYLTFDQINGVNFVTVLFHIIFTSITGGYALGNFIIKNNFASKYLLIASLFFVLNVFALGVKYYYLDLQFLKPIAMLFFIVGHYLFLEFILTIDSEEKIHNEK